MKSFRFSFLPLGVFLFCFFTAQGFAQGRLLQSGVFYQEGALPLYQTQGGGGAAARARAAEVTLDNNGLKLYGPKKVPEANYAGALTVSFLVGFGLGSLIENDKTGLIIFSVSDAALFFSGGSLLLHWFYAEKEPPREVFLSGVVLLGLYGLVRVVEFIYNAAYPFVDFNQPKKVAYYRSKERFVMSKIPMPFMTGKGGGLNFQYAFDRNKNKS